MVNKIVNGCPGVGRSCPKQFIDRRNVGDSGCNMAAGSFVLRNLLRSKYFGLFLCFALIHCQKGFAQDIGEIETFDLLMPNVLPKKVSPFKCIAMLLCDFYTTRKSTDQYMYAV